MGCVHPPSLVVRIEKADGTPGIQCCVCGSTAFRGESFWQQLKRNWFGKDKG